MTLLVATDPNWLKKKKKSDSLCVSYLCYPGDTGQEQLKERRIYLGSWSLGSHSIMEGRHGRTVQTMAAGIYSRAP
jgi:hypothetical protein